MQAAVEKIYCSLNVVNRQTFENVEEVYGMQQKSSSWWAAFLYTHATYRQVKKKG